MCKKMIIYLFLLVIPKSWVTGTMVVHSSSFCAIARLKPSQVPPLHMHVGSLAQWLHARCQEVSKCSTRGESWGMYITFASTKIVNKAEHTLALKPRGDVTRNPKQGYQWPQKGHVSIKNFLKKNKKKLVIPLYGPTGHLRGQGHKSRSRSHIKVKVKSRSTSN